jgi:LmbE family N-acetylglucosaminyl deacetylase
MSQPQLTLLAVLAHPDDESFGPGGTLARYAAEGVAVHLVTLTRGDVGMGEEVAQEAGFDSLASKRIEELHCASRVLGVASLEVLDYRDSGMPGSDDNSHPCSLAKASQDRVVRQIQDRMMRIRPDVVLSHGPHGDYGHPDHLAAYRATTHAFHRLRQERPGEAPHKLYNTTFPRRALGWAIRLLRIRGTDPRRVGANQDIDLVGILDSLPPVAARIDVLDYLETKARAAACHGTQGGAGQMARGLPRFLARRIQRYETFSRVHPPVQRGEPAERDFFTGLR